MKRKTIGVFLSGDDEQLQGAFLLGIKEEAHRRNCNIISFFNLFNKPSFGEDVTLAPSIQRGESSVFLGHDFSQLDAVIMFGDSFFSSDIKEQIITRSLDNNIPIIDVDDYDERCPCISYSDACGMEIMMRHVVEEHDCQKIYFVSGFPGNRQSEDRIESYKKILAENGIPINDEYICYGEFFGPTASKNIKPIIDKHGLPDAIVCANDVMAIGVIRYLNSIGCKTPDDCIVTGFDGIKEGQIYIPSITSIKRAIHNSGVKAVESACQALCGEKLEQNTLLDPILIKNSSCGCVPTEEYAFDNFFTLMNNRVDNRNYFNSVLNDMSRAFENCNTIDDILKTAFRNVAFFNVPEISFYLCEDVAHPNEMSMVQELYQRKKNDAFYSDNMVGIKWTEKDGISQQFDVEIKDFITKIVNEADEPVFLGISPMYYQERIIGFATLDHTYCLDMIPMLYTWLVNICTYIGNYCLRTEMSMLIDRLDKMYVKDSLTNLNNRFGLHRFAKHIERYAAMHNTKLFGIVIDLDGLKTINDSHGHNAGDNAISQIANAMRYASHNGEIMSRTGGDEFFVFGYCKSNREPEEFIKQMNDYLNEYNRSHDLPYKVDCSCGYYVSHTQLEDLENIMRIADMEMYRNKILKKQA